MPTDDHHEVTNGFPQLLNSEDMMFADVQHHLRQVEEAGRSRTGMRDTNIISFYEECEECFALFGEITSWHMKKG